MEKIFSDFFFVVGNDTTDSRKNKNLTSIILNELLKKMFAYSSYDVNDLVNQFKSQGLGKHILVNFYTPKLQDFSEKYDLSGQIKSYSSDYLQVNHSLFSDRRFNWNLLENVTKSTEPQKDNVVSTLVIELTGNPHFDQSGIENVDDWLRVYVPQGSRLTESQGFSEEVKVGEDLGKSYFAGLVKLGANKKSTLTIKYQLPKSLIPENEYRLLVQKQPGTADFKYKVSLGDKSQEFNLSQDKEINFDL